MTTNKPNTLFWIIAVVALLWNLFGVLQFLTMTVMRDAALTEMPAEMVEILKALPPWYNYVFALAVIPAVIASLSMLFRRSLAIPLFGLSLIALLTQFGYWLFGTRVMEVEGVVAALMPVIVIAAGIFLYFYSKGAALKGWLR